MKYVPNPLLMAIRDLFHYSFRNEKESCKKCATKRSLGVRMIPNKIISYFCDCVRCQILYVATQVRITKPLFVHCLIYD